MVRGEEGSFEESAEEGYVGGADVFGDGVEEVEGREEVRWGALRALRVATRKMC